VGTGRCGSTLLSRFVHLHRDGPDCALSMSRHPMFRQEILAAAARHGTGLPPASPLPQVDAALPVRLRGMICPPYDAARLMAHPIPASRRLQPRPRRRPQRGQLGSQRQHPRDPGRQRRRLTPARAYIQSPADPGSAFPAPHP
jgi:hypothetical protein